jgi:hypothetical protein
VVLCCIIALYELSVLQAVPKMGYPMDTPEKIPMGLSEKSEKKT